MEEVQGDGNLLISNQELRNQLRVLQAQFTGVQKRLRITLRPISLKLLFVVEIKSLIL
ncbi:hypothetical protein I3842_01G133800 [Carya illinoinensis]|uniref:Uncharacterized protein n=1 Tax=Carya illinoinensis TaxID=32201 RepID=A0A922G001_CARIL|nr:hypothetical protein I3842_01G133800 [Carya illinoinensis]